MQHKKRKIGVLVSLIMLLTTTASAQAIQYTLDKNGFPELSYKGKKIFNVIMPFWGANWKYATIQSTPDPNDSTHWTGKCTKRLFFTNDIKWDLSGKNKMVGIFTFDVSKTVDPAVGGGIEFRLSLKDLKSNMGAGDPILLGKKGWKWQLGKEKFIKITFDSELTDVYFERGNKSRIRCMFFVKSAVLRLR